MTDSTYCTNPDCNNRMNLGGAMVCQSCGAPVVTLLNNRYGLLRPLRDPNLLWNAEVFEGIDMEDGDQLKVIKILSKSEDRYVRLFEQEQRILMELRHPGIPIGEDAFDVVTSDGSALHCLVMERIEGYDLDRWCQENTLADEAQALNWLEQVVQTLQYVHDNNFFHRDIKPSNIMLRLDGCLVLIDFGTARYISETVVNGRSVTIAMSYGYTAPEQCIGHAVPQSDFYALGCTFMHLLTGQNPSDLDPEKHWSQQTQTPISDEFENLLDRMMSFDPTKRPRNAKELLKEIQLLQRGTTLTKLVAKVRRHWHRIGLVLLAVSTALIITFIASHREQTIAACDANIGDFLSCGEKVFIKNNIFDKGHKIPSEKEQAAKAFRLKDFSGAENLFGTAWQKSVNSNKGKYTDPETLIYLNNARVEQRINSNKKEKVYTIAVAAPLGDAQNSNHYVHIGIDMLKAVAMAQQQAIENTRLNLRVIIANDANQSNVAQNIAKALGKRDVIAVVGHYSSEINKAVLDIYGAHKVVAISGTSNSSALSSASDNSYFFRTISTSQQAVATLIKALQDNNVHRVALYGSKKHEPGSTIAREFKEKFEGSSGKVVDTQDLSEYEYDDQHVTGFFEKMMSGDTKAEAIALFPSLTDAHAFKNMLKIVKNNKDGLQVVGNNVLYHTAVLQRYNKEASQYPSKQSTSLPQKKIAITSDWHYSLAKSLVAKKFVKDARELWNSADVHSRIATTYDAARILIAAISHLPDSGQSPLANREKMRKIIAESVTDGVTGTIKFKGSDRANPQPINLTIRKSCNSDALEFWPLENAKCSGE